jgi:CO dehydrogenase maturation factor
MARDLGIQSIFVVGNKVGSPEELAFLKENFPDSEFLGAISFDRSVIDADLKGIAPYDAGSPVVAETAAILDKLFERIRKES